MHRLVQDGIGQDMVALVQPGHGAEVALGESVDGLENVNEDRVR